jgi:hypothetical protein
MAAVTIHSVRTIGFQSAAERGARGPAGSSCVIYQADGAEEVFVAGCPGPDGFALVSANRCTLKAPFLERSISALATSKAGLSAAARVARISPARDLDRNG